MCAFVAGEDYAGEGRVENVVIVEDACVLRERLQGPACRAECAAEFCVRVCCAEDVRASGVDLSVDGVGSCISLVWLQAMGSNQLSRYGRMQKTL